MNFFKNLFGKKNESYDQIRSGINIEYAHERAKALIKDDFFWDDNNELAPFGSYEGESALNEFRSWRIDNPYTPTIECLKLMIENIGDMDFYDYNLDLLSIAKIKSQIDDINFDDNEEIYTLDISIIAAGFGQLVDEGVIEEENKKTIQLAINRQIVWSELSKDWKDIEDAKEYVNNLKILKQILKEA